MTPLAVAVEVSSGAAAVAGRGDSAGSSTTNVAPFPGTLSTPIDPPWPSTIPWHIESPSPVPWPEGFVVKNGSKIRAAISGGIPGPLSVTRRTTRRLVGSRRVDRTRRRGAATARAAW
jgi:hypothetical protein